MLDYWTNFMKTGDPNGNGLAPWNPCTAANPAVMELK
ncbi:MAG: carboxylesterase family protein [Clostridiales bacterium]|nr:carboxylesterase family protein [Clostridiales bacterium]